VKELLRRRYINLLSIIGVLAILSLSFITYLYVLRLSQASDWTIHSHEVIEKTEAILINTYLAESSQRTYFLTGDKSHIAVFNNTLDKILNGCSKLLEMVKDNPDHQAQVKKFTQTIDQRLYLLKNNIQIYQKDGLQASIILIKTDKNKFLSNEIKQLSNKIISDEKDILVFRTNEIYKNTLKVIFITLIGNLFCLSLIMFCVWLLNRELTFRIKAENKISDSEQELIRLAYYDSLTGLPNRTMLIDNLEQKLDGLASTKSLALLLIDIDNFKNINNSLTHDVGDDVIIAVAERLQVILSSDDIISRVGGDEFAVLTLFESIDNVEKVAKNIKNSFKEALIIRGKNIFITVSTGISIYPINGLDAKTLLKNADIAMYRAKELDRNNYQFCTPEMTLQVEEKALLDYHLHQALQHSEFILLYQPKISLKNEEIIGIEVLLRWNRPAVGLVSPESFIGLAESNGLIVPISEWLLRAVCKQGKKWQSEGLPIHNIAINISTRQFSIQDFAANIKNILNETGFDPRYLEFEITERILMENSFDNFAALKALKNMGIKITIDDFGTGYSSLNYLRLFSVDKIKIDKSFIDEITAQNKNYNIVNAIIMMAHGMGIIVVAEGVETSIQAAILKSYDCDEVQGFLYNRPLSEKEIERLLRKH
jgi:diguanylate cyclase (GGDEF)-like protein